MQLHINNWSHQLESTLASDSTTVGLSVEATARLTGLGAGDHYALTLTEVDSAGREVAWEVVHVTAASAGLLTITRAQEGTSDREWPIGTLIEARLTAGAIQEIRDSAGAVQSVNGQTGAVVLAAADVGAATAAQGALADTAIQSADLAAVATSGAYSDLTGKPFIPSTPGDIGAATAAQGALADTAVQPAALNAGLDGKVDKLAGYGLSSNDFTSDEKTKLAGLEGSHYKGTYTTLTALQAALPAGVAGDYADVDGGAGSPVLRYIWDVQDGWTAQAGSADPVTAAQVKTLYESNADTNAFTDSEKAKLAGVATGATANADTDSLAEGATNLYHTGARVRGTLLDGMSTATTTVIAATDSVLTATGKLAGRLETAFSRANHTGTQAISTIDNLQTTLDDKMANPMTAQGDLIVGGTSGAPARLAKGTDGQVLKLVSGAPAWATDETGSGGAFDRYDLATVASTETLDLSAANVFTIDATVTARTLAFANEPAAGRSMCVTLYIAGNAGVTLPAGVQYSGSTPPELGASWTVLVLLRANGTWTARSGGAA